MSAYSRRGWMEVKAVSGLFTKVAIPVEEKKSEVFTCTVEKVLTK